MPRAKTEQEKERMKQQLQAIAEELLQHQSIRKISVDDLVSQANIAKGTFYRYYETKEGLFFDVFLKRHNQIQDLFLQTIKEQSLPITADSLTNTIMKLLDSIQSSFLLPFIHRGDLELLMRSLPDSAHQEHFARDQWSMKQLHGLFPHLSEVQLDTYTAAIRLALVSILHQKEIGVDWYHPALRITIYGIILQMMRDDQA